MGFLEIELAVLGTKDILKVMKCRGGAFELFIRRGPMTARLYSFLCQSW